MGLGAFLMSRVTTILQASLFFALAGLGAAACWAPVVALAQKWTSDERRGLTLSFIDIGSALSIIAMAAFVPFIVRKYDWQAGWMILGIITAAVGVFNFLVIKNPPQVQEITSRVKKTGVPFSTLLQSSKFWLFGLGYMFVGLRYYGTVYFFDHLRRPGTIIFFYYCLNYYDRAGHWSHCQQAYHRPDF